MKSLYLQKGTSGKVTPPLGFCFLTVGERGGNVNENIIIPKEQNNKAYNKGLLNRLNSGLISQRVYNAIKTEQGENRAVYLLNTGIDINKESLINLVKNHSIQNVDTEGTAASIINGILAAGYQIIKKL
jgi:hypothetical protein